MKSKANKKNKRIDLIEELEVYLSRPIMTNEAQSFTSSSQRRKAICDDKLITSLDEEVNRPDGEKFRDLLFKLIELKGFKSDPEVYKAADISRSVFSRIKNYKRNHRPSKDTVTALCIGLRLNIDEAQELYNAASHDFAQNSKYDRIIRFFIVNEIYVISDVNFALNHYGLPVLRSKFVKTKVCDYCGVELTKEEVGVSIKILKTKDKQSLCADCMEKHLGISVKNLKREMGNLNSKDDLFN